MNLEDQLQAALRRAADQDRDAGTGLGEVKGRARRIRTRRRASAVAVAAAVVVVVGTPTALLVRDQSATTAPPAHRGSPAPTVTAVPTPPTPTHTPSSRPSPTHNPTPSAGTLASIPRGAATFVAWADATGVVHSQGSTSQLPGPMSPDVQFHELHGGWVVTGGNANTARVYDASGKQTASGRAAGIAVTADRTRLGWMMGGKLYESGLSTMGIVPPTPTPDTVSVPANASLIGYLPQGPALLSPDGSLQVVSGSATTAVPIDMAAVTTSQSAGLVGGVTGSPAQGDLAGAVYDVGAGKRLWHNGWRPLRFSDDGTLLAAVPVGANGDPSTIAILDARTGRVVAQTHSLGTGLFLGLSVAWDGHRLLFSAVGDHAKQAALLALDTRGTITRLSDVLTAPQPGGAYVLFEAQP